MSNGGRVKISDFADFVAALAAAIGGGGGGGGGEVEGVDAHSAPVTGKPILIGAYAVDLVDGALVDVAPGDLTYLRTDAFGRLIIATDPAGSVRTVGNPLHRTGAVTVSTTQYAPGDVLGGVGNNGYTTLVNPDTLETPSRGAGRGGVFQRLTYIGPVDSLSLNAILWSAAPTSHPADNAAFVLSDTNRDIAVHEVTLTRVSGYSNGSGGNNYRYAADLGALPIGLSSGGTNIRVTLINTSGTPTFSSSAGGVLILSQMQE